MKHILLVEDTIPLAEEIADSLQLEGYEVTHAPNGEAGMAILPATDPDIIITDLLMPGIDGFEFIRRVRKKTKAIPIIILSAKI
jgi:DNA-binding response OmpR family regulator